MVAKRSPKSKRSPRSKKAKKYVPKTKKAAPKKKTMVPWDFPRLLYATSDYLVAKTGRATYANSMKHAKKMYPTYKKTYTHQSPTDLGLAIFIKKNMSK